MDIQVQARGQGGDVRGIGHTGDDPGRAATQQDLARLGHAQAQGRAALVVPAVDHHRPGGQSGEAAHLRRDRPDDSARREDGRKVSRLDASQRAQLGAPLSGGDVQELHPASVGRVAAKAARQAVDEEIVYGKVALSGSKEVGLVLAQPGDGRQAQAGVEVPTADRADLGLNPLRSPALDQRFGTAIQPGNDGRERRTVPPRRKQRPALGGEGQGQWTPTWGRPYRDGAQDVEQRLPQLLRILLNPAGLRRAQPVGLLRHSQLGPGQVEQNRLGRRCADVQAEDPSAALGRGGVVHRFVASLRGYPLTAPSTMAMKKMRRAKRKTMTMGRARRIQAAAMTCRLMMFAPRKSYRPNMTGLSSFFETSR